MLLIDLLHSACLVCFLMQNRSGTTHSKIGLPTSITNQENAPQTCLYSNLIEEIPQLRFLLPNQVHFVSSWQKLKWAAQHTTCYINKTPMSNLNLLMKCFVSTRENQLNRIKIYLVYIVCCFFQLAFSRFWNSRFLCCNYSFTICLLGCITLLKKYVCCTCLQIQGLEFWIKIQIHTKHTFLWINNLIQ